MAEEAPRGGVDAIGAAAEIDAVEIEFEDLVLGEAPFERQREDRLADLAGEGEVVGEEDVAGELLGDGRAALRPMARRWIRTSTARDDADRIDADMASGSGVSSTEIIASRMIGGISVVGQPFAEHRAQRDEDDLAVGGVDPDHLAEIVAADQLLIARQLADRDRDRDAERDQRRRRDHRRRSSGW